MCMADAILKAKKPFFKHLWNVIFCCKKQKIDNFSDYLEVSTRFDGASGAIDIMEH